MMWRAFTTNRGVFFFFALFLVFHLFFVGDMFFLTMGSCFVHFLDVVGLE